MNGKYLAITLILSLSGVAYGMEPGIVPEIIKDASYWVSYDCDSYSKVLTGQAKATFYTATGQEIRKERYEESKSLFELEMMLDPQAPKPQPTSYKLKLLSGRLLPWGHIKGTQFLLFYDKNGYVLRREEYNEEPVESFGEKLDLSVVRDETVPFDYEVQFEQRVFCHGPCCTVSALK